MPTLREVIVDLEPAIRERVSAIWVEGGPDWRARMSIALTLRDTRPRSEIGDYAISINTDDLPEGVEVTARSRVDDVVRHLGLGAAITSQIQELEQSGIVGRLRACRYDDGGIPRYLVKTHAGSDEERAAWLRSIGPSNA